MQEGLNPFHTLYISEIVRPEEFVDVFSPLLVPDTKALFEAGNVVLMGVQGSGKTMLLALLKPETRIAYSKARRPFPISGASGRFIGAGINLTRSGAIDFGQRPLPGNTAEAMGGLPAMFGDFVNYWVVKDLLASVMKLLQHQDLAGIHEMGLSGEGGRWEDFARQVSRHPTWAGGLDETGDVGALRAQIEARIRTFRDFFNFNTPTIPPRLLESKSSPGEPISVVAEILRGAGIVPFDVDIYVRIDQYEELSRLEDWSRDRGLFEDYRHVIHKMLGLRDHRVSYRIGTRRKEWDDRPRMYGTHSVLEQMRNYILLDLDALLRRQENTPWLFRQFAEDVFARRVVTAGYGLPSKTPALRAVMRPRLGAERRARVYARKSDQVVRVDPSWPEDVVHALQHLSVENPLSAKLGEAWVCQQMQRDVPELPSVGHYPWEDRKVEWWRKERVDLALLQLAAQNRQRMIWHGSRDLLELSGSNILVFLNLCQAVWASWLRTEEAASTYPGGPLPKIEDPHVQDEGIHAVSEAWVHKIASDPGGEGRSRFISFLAQLFRRSLREDRNMSYPGHNGFSLPLSSTKIDSEVRAYIQDAVAFGSLYDVIHTSRNRGEGKREKWYLAPVYSPYFQIPASHKKEPLYVSDEDVRGWLTKIMVMARAENAEEEPRGDVEGQMRLPFNSGD